MIRGILRINVDADVEKFMHGFVRLSHYEMHFSDTLKKARMELADLTEMILNIDKNQKNFF